MRRTLAIAALVVALGAGSHADACWLWARLRPRRLIQLCSRGHAPVVVDRTVPPRGDLPPNTQPPLPVSDYHEVVALVPDPQNPGYFLYRVRRGPNADSPALERSTSFDAFVRRYPEFAAQYGIRIVKVGGEEFYEYPAMEGINQRIEKLGQGVPFWRDRDAEDTDHFRMARSFVERGDMVLSLNAPIAPEGPYGKRSYHFHDMFVHVLGFQTIPKTVLEASRGRIKALLAIYDHPDLRDHAALKQHIEYEIRREIGALDQASADIQAQLGRLRPPPTRGERDVDVLNLSLILDSVARGSTGITRALRERSDGWGLSRRQRSTLDRLIGDITDGPTLNVEDQATALAARFRAGARP